MKKLFGILVSLCASMICLTSVSAKQVDLTKKEFNNSYIIGRRIFTLNSYALSAWNVKEATDEFHKNFKGTDKTPIYYIVDGRIWSVSGDGIDWKNPIEISAFNETFGNDFFGVNGDPIVSPTLPYEKEKVDNKIESVIETLKDTADKYGFDNIEYNEENNKVTFTIGENDGDKNISDYAKSGIVDAIKAFISDDYGAKKIVIDDKEYDVNTLNEAGIVGLAADYIRKAIGNVDNETLSALKGKSMTATVTYGDGTEVKYTVTFA